MRRLLKDAGFMLIAVVGLHSGTLVSSQSELVAQAPSPLPLSPGGRGQGEGAQAPSQTKDASVEVKVVKYDGLKEAVTNLKGSLVVVDFWSTT